MLNNTASFAFCVSSQYASNISHPLTCTDSEFVSKISHYNTFKELESFALTETHAGFDICASKISVTSL